MVVGVVGVGGGGALEEGDGITTLTAGGYGLIVNDLRKRKTAGDELEGSFGVGVLAGVEAGETQIEAGFKGATIVGRNLGKGCGGVVVIAIGELSFAESEEGGGIVRGGLGGELQALDAFELGGRGDAADVVFEGAEGDISGGTEECLLGDAELRVDLPGDGPGDGVFDVKEASEFAGVLEGLRHAEVMNVENLDLNGDAGLVDGVAADDDEVCVEGLGDADGGGARGLEVDGEAEMVQGELAVVAGDGEKA